MSSKSLTSAWSRGLDVAVENSTETINPMKEGACEGTEVIGAKLGKLVGAEVMNNSQKTNKIKSMGCP